MARFPAFDPVNYLVAAWFPLIRMVRANGVNFTKDQEGSQKLIEAAEIYESELRKLGADEINSRVAEQRVRDRENELLKAEKEEAGRLFNRPDAKADFDYWAKMALWSIDETVALSLERDPRKVTWKLVEAYTKVSAFAALFADRRNLMRRAVAASQLGEANTPGFFLAWADRFKLTIPDALTKAVTDLGVEIADWKTRYDEAVALVTALREERQQNHDRHIAAMKDHSDSIDKFRRHMEDLASGHELLIAGKDELIAGKDRLIADHEETIAALTARVAELEAATLPIDKALGTRERDSLLKLVIGMAMDGYGYDPNASRSPIAREIAGHLALMDLTIDEDTVRKYLTDARELLSAGETERKG